MVLLRSILWACVLCLVKRRGTMGLPKQLAIELILGMSIGTVNTCIIIRAYDFGFLADLVLTYQVLREKSAGKMFLNWKRHLNPSSCSSELFSWTWLIWTRLFWILNSPLFQTPFSYLLSANSNSRYFEQFLVHCGFEIAGSTVVP